MKAFTKDVSGAKGEKTLAGKSSWKNDGSVSKREKGKREYHESAEN